MNRRTQHPNKNGINQSFDFKSWVLEVFQDERDHASIKPIIAFFGALFLCASLVVNAFFPGYAPSDSLVDAVMIITSIGMGADSIDKFSRKKSVRERSGRDEYDEYDESSYEGDGGYGGSDQSNNSTNNRNVNKNKNDGDIL